MRQADTPRSDSSYSKEAIEIAEEFLNLVRTGDSVSVADFMSVHPHLEAELNELLPTMLAMEELSKNRKSAAACDTSVGTEDTIVDVEHEFESGQIVFDRYRIVRPIGKGAMGVVYHAEDTTLRRQVALKIPRADIYDRPEIQRFEREARAMANVRHPQIAAVYDLGTAGRYFMAMEYVDGTNLNDWVLQNGKMPWREAVDCIFQVQCGQTQEFFVIHEVDPPMSCVTIFLSIHCATYSRLVIAT